MPHPLRRRYAAALALVGVLATVACSDDDDVSSANADPSRPLTISAIPDQDPEQLQRLYGTVSEHLGEVLGIEVEYVPVTDYAASVSLFRTGDLDLVWFGGLTGVQARLQAPGSHAIAQRDIDEQFNSVFIANVSAGIEPIDEVAGLTALEGTRFTFGSESSTSGRLMPQHFLDLAGVGIDDFDGPAGFSGSHDTTIELVTSGTYQTGVLNEQVWASRMEEGAVDRSQVVEVFRTPAYHDYHWVIGGDVEDEFGEGFIEEVQQALLDLEASDPEAATILELFGAERFIETEDGNYDQIEEVGRRLGLVT